MLCTWMQDKKVTAGVRVSWRIGIIILGSKGHHIKLYLLAKLKWISIYFSIPRCCTRHTDWEASGKSNRNNNTRDEKNHPMPEKEPFVQNMDELQLMIEETNKDVFAKDASISATCCVCLKAENVVEKFIDSVAMEWRWWNWGKGYIMHSLFVSKLRMLTKVKLILKSIWKCGRKNENEVWQEISPCFLKSTMEEVIAQSVGTCYQRHCRRLYRLDTDELFKK